LRKLKIQDAEDIYRYASDSEVARFVTWEPHESVIQSKKVVYAFLECYRNNQPAPWGIVHVAENRLIGTCGFVSYKPENGRAEIGYAIAREFWGHGYTTEAVCAVVAFGFRKLQLNRIEARCFPNNEPSERVMQKAGMKYEGLLRQYMLTKGTYRDLKVYSILRSEYEGNSDQEKAGDSL